MDEVKSITFSFDTRPSTLKKASHPIQDLA